jgi:hypothetical protein
VKVLPTWILFLYFILVCLPEKTNPSEDLKKSFKKYPRTREKNFDFRVIIRSEFVNLSSIV